MHNHNNIDCTIREKGHKIPAIDTITKRLEQKNSSYAAGEIKEAVERLIGHGQVENRGENGEESLYMVTPDVLQKPNPFPNANAKCTHEECILLRTQVETLLKASRSNHGNNVGKQSEKEKELKEELLLLKKEN